MSEIEQQMIQTLERVETEHSENMAAWRDAFESLQTEYAQIRADNETQRNQIERLSAQVNELADLFAQLRKR